MLRCYSCLLNSSTSMISVLTINIGYYSTITNEVKPEVLLQDPQAANWMSAARAS